MAGQPRGYATACKTDKLVRFQSPPIKAIKETAPHYSGVKMQRNNAMRVVEDTRQLAPRLGKRMIGIYLRDRSAF
jgi:hypothetical protein